MIQIYEGELKDAWSVVDLVGCPRRLFFLNWGCAGRPGEGWDPRGDGTATAGELWAETILLPRMGLGLLEVQGLLTGHLDHHPLVGRYDLLAERPDGRKLILEVKTLRLQPEQRDYWQCELYLRLAPTVDHALLIYILFPADFKPRERLGSWEPFKGVYPARRVLPVYRDPERLSAIKRRIQRIGEAPPTSVPPRLPIVNGRPHWSCRFCEFWHLCWDGWRINDRFWLRSLQDVSAAACCDVFMDDPL